VGLDFGVLDIRVVQVVGHICNAPTGLQGVDGNRVKQLMHRPPLDAAILGIIHQDLAVTRVATPRLWGVLCPHASRRCPP